MRWAVVLIVLSVALPVALPAPATASTVPSAPPVISDPAEEPPPTPENQTMWFLLGVSALLGIVLLLVYVWSSERPEGADRAVPPAGNG